MCPQRSDAAADFDAVNFGDHEVEEHKVRRAVASSDEAIFAVMCDVDLVALMRPRRTKSAMPGSSSITRILVISCDGLPSQAGMYTNYTCRPIGRAESGKVALARSTTVFPHNST